MALIFNAASVECRACSVRRVEGPSHYYRPMPSKSIIKYSYVRALHSPIASRYPPCLCPALVGLDGFPRELSDLARDVLIGESRCEVVLVVHGILRALEVVLPFLDLLLRWLVRG